MKQIKILSMVAAAGLIAGCSSWGNHDNNGATAEMTLDQLPQAAQTSIRNEVGDQQIYSIKQESKDGQVAYKVEVERRGMDPMHPSLIVSQDGSILKESRELADRRQKMNEAAGAQNNNVNLNNPSAPANSTQAPSEANPAGTNPNTALPSANGNTTPNGQQQ